MNESTKALDARHMMDLGYRDYLAARFLIVNDMALQGAILACFAVEKYLKSVMICKGLANHTFHITDWRKLKGQIGRDKDKLFEKLDEVFLQLLAEVYELRYYNKLKSDKFYGFVNTQFLAELDFTVAFIESTIFEKNEATNSEFKHGYKFDVQNAEPKLTDNNYVLQGIDKKSFMTRPGKLVALSIRHKKDEIIINGPVRPEFYEGHITVLKKLSIEAGGDNDKVHFEFNYPINLEQSKI